MNEAQARKDYKALTASGDLARAIHGLSDEALRNLVQWLQIHRAQAGIPGMVLGLLECEAAERFMQGGGQ